MKISIALIIVIAWIGVTFPAPAIANYALGCKDPEYHAYIETRFNHFEAVNKRRLTQTLRDYERSLATSDNPFQVIGDLSRHLKYSAQFDDINVVTEKINRIFEHSNALSVEQQIAGDVFDSFSSETHAVGIARAWIAYRQEAHQAAFKELLNSIELNDSALLSSFGPDFALIRQMYRDGHIAPVIAYINKTKSFWTGRRPDSLRYAWGKMIEAGCKVQFESNDLAKMLELGVSEN